MHDFLLNGYLNSNRDNLELFVTVSSLIIEPESPSIESRITDHYATEIPFVRCNIALSKNQNLLYWMRFTVKILNICREGYMTEVNYL